MKTLRRLLSLLLIAAAVSSVSACSSITAFDDCTGNPGSDTRCD